MKSFVILALLVLSGRFSGSLAGATLEAPVLDLVRSLGTPALVQSTDDGHEWRWFDAHGIDVDVLTDDQLVVRQVLVARPEAIQGKAQALVQPAELPLLEMPVASAEKALLAAGAQHQAEPDKAISAWRIDDNYVVLELQRGEVARILALDATAAQHFGYAGGSTLLTAHRAPRLVHQAAMDYPHRAIANHAEGVVIVAVDVAASGAVKSARVLLSSGNSDIDDAEVQSMRRSTFRPARCAGEPCAGLFLDREEYALVR